MVNSIPHAPSPQTTTLIDISPHTYIARQCTHLSLYLGQEHQTKSNEEREDELTGLRPKEVPLAEEPQRGIGLCWQLTTRDRYSTAKHVIIAFGNYVRITRSNMIASK